MDEDETRIAQIAQVFVDLLSMADDAEEGEAFRRQIVLASQRAFELGGLTFTKTDTGFSINPEALMAGALAAMSALMVVLEENTSLDEDAVISAWREQIDADD